MEPYRPRYHLTPAEGWINDPNGLCHFAGEWHCFFQHYDPKIADGQLWGHFVSDDLIHWKRRPSAILPDKLGRIWSGSAVVDNLDTSGLFGGEPGMVCLYTYFDPADGRQSQGLAFSSDGLTFQKHAKNPVIPQLRHVPGQPDDADFRDPKVFWHEETRRWVMAVAGGKLRIFTSTNLIDWNFESVNDDLTTECPDLFPMNLDGDASKRRWILSGGGRWYMIGDFDGRKFSPRSERIPFTTAPDWYAGQTFDNAPMNRRIMISWLYGWQYGQTLEPQGIAHPMPTKPWSGGGFGVPYELKLITTPTGERITQQPIEELKSLRQPILSIANRVLNPGENPLAPVVGPALDIELVAASTFNLRIAADMGRYYDVHYDLARKMLSVDRRHAGLDKVPTFSQIIEMPLSPDAAGKISLRILLDGNSVEIISADGLTLLPAVIFPSSQRATLDLSTRTGQCRIDQLDVFRMSPAIT